ncbi:TM2 domain-containing protein [Ferrimonas senticii]|uniref:TM2 domain-containing protein n=1 Tax=Ferrimonas senticii TaxID=394566 RepID=UPI00041BEE97|nr:TM2 domain-containing protein [Ferrimonas senticii]
MPRITCSHCHQSTRNDLALCQYCHSGLHLEALAGVDPTLRFRCQTLAARYGLYLGSFGVHRFYLGDHLRGSLYLAFCWTLVPTVLGIIDGIKLQRMATEQFQQRWRCQS